MVTFVTTKHLQHHVFFFSWFTQKRKKYLICFYFQGTVHLWSFNSRGTIFPHITVQCFPLLFSYGIFLFHWVSYIATVHKRSAYSWWIGVSFSARYVSFCRLVFPAFSLRQKIENLPRIPRDHGKKNNFLYAFMKLHTAIMRSQSTKEFYS